MTPSTGPFAGGSTVTLLGARLGANDLSAVLFGTQAASAVTWISDSHIEVAAPAAAASGSVAVSLTSTLYGSVSLPAAFVINPAPAITAVVPSVGPNSGQQSITITGSTIDEHSSFPL